MKNKFKLLDQGYFIFPLMQKGKEFIVLDTISIYLKDKKIIGLYDLFQKSNNLQFIGMLAEVYWKAIKQEKLDKIYKDYWLVPIHINKIGDELMVDFDVLKPIKGGGIKK